MSLSALTWKQLAAVTPASSSCAGVLDALYTAFTATTYNDGSSRTAGSGQAIAATRYQNAGTTEALYGVFTSASVSTTLKWCIAGVNAARTPNMDTDTYANNIIMGQITRDAGAFASWDHATNIFTSGNDMGYFKLWSCANTIAKVRLYECAEAFIVIFEKSDNTCFIGAFGCFIDPESTEVTCCETDGRIYAQMTTGSTTTWSSSSNTGNTTACLFVQTATNGGAHFKGFTPRTTTELSLNKNTLLVASTTTSLANAAGEPVSIPVDVYNTTGTQWFGRLREIKFVRDSKTGLKQGSSWYYISGSTSTDQDAMGLMQ